MSRMNFDHSAFSFVGIDVIHHKGYVFLRKTVKASVAAIRIGKDSSDQLMIDLDSPFLKIHAGIHCKTANGIPIRIRIVYDNMK